ATPSADRTMVPASTGAAAGAATAATLAAEGAGAGGEACAACGAGAALLPRKTYAPAATATKDAATATHAPAGTARLFAGDACADEEAAEAATAGAGASAAGAATASRSACANSLPPWKRSFGFLASALRTTASSAGASDMLICEGGTGSSRSTLYMIVVVDSPVKGFSPVSIWYRMTPQEKMSLRPSTGWPMNCSGDM